MIDAGAKSDLKSLRIVFMGTPEFAVASLAKLVDAGCNIICVITAPDKAGGRGMQLQQSAVKKYALDQQLKILQPEKLKNPEFLHTLKELNADLQVVVAFRMLPEAVWNMPPMGTVNVHGSLLPQYRGAAPINWAVINGEKQTGVTTFQLKHEIDTGAILLSHAVEILETDNAGFVHDKLKAAGADLLLETIQGLANHSLRGKEQAAASEVLQHAPKLTSATGNIDWQKTTFEINNLIRGLSPYPAAHTKLQGKNIKIFKAKATTSDTAHEAGEVSTDGKTFLRFYCCDGFLDLLEIQPEGKKRMDIKDFLRGFRSEKTNI